MPKIRDALDLLDQQALVALGEKRGLRSARSNADRRKTLAYSYRGNVAELLGDLTRAQLVFLLREWGGAERGRGLAAKSRAEVEELVRSFFDVEASSEERARPKAPPGPLPPAVDALLPGWLVRLDTPPGSRDPLGLQAVSAARADRLLPGLTVFTSRARYYGFLCWSLSVAQRDPNATSHRERAQRLERLLVLGEALHHEEDPRACVYIGGRRGRAYLRECGPGPYALPTRILKNQTSNGAHRLYRTSMVDLELLEEHDTDGGLGVVLTDAGTRLAECYGEGVDERLVDWALADGEHRKRRETLLQAVPRLCLSGRMSARERKLVLAALFGRRIEEATASAHLRRATAHALLREGILSPRANQPDILAEDADAIVEDGGVEAATNESRGNWRVVRELVARPRSHALAELQVAAAYQLLVVALNQIFRSAVVAVALAGRLGVSAYLEHVGEAIASRDREREPSSVVARADACFDAMASWADIGATGLALLRAILHDAKVYAWLAELAADSTFLGEVLDARRVEAEVATSGDPLLGVIVPLLVRRHREESVRKGKGEWLALEDGHLVRRDPRELVPLVHSLRFAQLEQLISDLGVGVEEVGDVA